jgi:hypothetical protein
MSLDLLVLIQKLTEGEVDYIMASAYYLTVR